MRGRRFLRDSLGFALSQYVARGAMLARGLAAAAALGPAGYGAWNALNLIFDYGSYAGAGAIQGLDLRLPGALAAGDAREARRLMAAAWSAVLVGGAIFTAGLLVVLGIGVAGFAILPIGAPLLMLAAALLQLAFQYFASALRSLGRVPAVSLGHAIQAGLGGGLGFALVWRFGVWGLLGGWLVGTLVALALMRRRGPEIPLLPGAPAAGVALARSGLPIFAYFAATLVLRSVDRIALVHAGAAESLGYYGLGLMVSISLLYLPESAAYVLFPRLAAAAAGARDPERTRLEALAVHRTLVTLLPIPVALAAVWIEPVVAWLLPEFRPGAPALRLLALGSLFFAAATVPGYALLAGPRRGRLVAVAIACAGTSAALVFAAAARSPTSASVAAAAVAGYAVFAVAILSLAAGEWFARAGERAWLLFVSLVPTLWTGAATLWVAAGEGGEAPRVALIRSLVVTVAAAPTLWFARGLGIRGLIREWRGTYSA